MTTETPKIDEAQDPGKGILRPALAWVGAAVVNAFAYLVLFAAGMKTAPSLDAGEALVAALGPASLAPILLWGVVRNLRAQALGRALAGYGLPLAACVLLLLMTLGTALA